MANDSASPTTDCIASVVSLGVHVIGRKRQVDCDGQKAGRKDALIGPLGGPSSYRPLSGRYLIRTAARRSGFVRSVDLEKLSVSWDEESKSVVMQQKSAPGFSGKSSLYDYTVQIPLSDVCKVLDCLAGLESEAVSDGVAPSLRSLLKLAASTVLPKPPLGERMEYLERLLEEIRGSDPDHGVNLRSGV